MYSGFNVICIYPLQVNDQLVQCVVNLLFASFFWLLGVVAQLTLTSCKSKKK